MVQLQKSRLSISEKLVTILNNTRCFKVDERMVIYFIKYKNSEPEPSDQIRFRSKTQVIMNEGDIMPSLELSQEKILNDIGIWVSQSSGWIIVRIDGHYVNIHKCNPLEGHSYIPLPVELRDKMKGLVNIQNKDDKCVMWCHARHENPNVKKNPPRITKLDIETAENVFDYKGADFPVSEKDYQRIEVQNHIKVNVLGYENKQFYPIYISRGIEDEDEMDILLITEGEKKHYVYFKDLNRMMYNNMEKYMAFMPGKHLVFIDSMQF